MNTLDRVFSTLLDFATSDREEFVGGVSSLLQRRVGLEEPDSVRYAEKLHASLIKSQFDENSSCVQTTDLKSILKDLSR